MILYHTFIHFYEMSYILIAALKDISRFPHKLLQVFNYIQIWSIYKDLAAN